MNILLALALVAPEPELPALPCPASCRQAMALNRQVRASIAYRMEFDGDAVWPRYQRALHDLDHAYHCYDWASVATGEPDTRGAIFDRPTVANRLRALLGEDAFMRGKLPDPVPWSALTEVP